MGAYTKNNRNLGIDILRALAMFFVIIQHIIGQGGLLENAPMGSGKFYCLSFLQILSYCAVDIYGITTGYLLSEKKFRLVRLSNVWMTTVFWSVAVSCCFFLFVPESRTISEMVSMFLPVLRGRYWFFTAYFVVMLVSPALNVVIRSLNKQQFHLLCAALFLIFGVVPICSLGYDVLRISTGHHFAWMIVLYLVGGYLRKNDREGGTTMFRSPGRWLTGYFTLAAAHLLYKFLTPYVGLEGYQNLLLTYPSPMILGEAVCLFLYFKDTCKKISGESFAGRLIRFVSPGVYSVYVIHVHPLIYWNDEMIALFRIWDGWSTATAVAALLGVSVAVFAACVLLDALRQRLFRLLRIDRAVQNVSDWIERRVREYVR